MRKRTGMGADNDDEQYAMEVGEGVIGYSLITLFVFPLLWWSSEGKLFAPGNLRAIQDNPGYKALHDYWLENKYQLRYTGGMVPDVNQILVKGKGKLPPTDRCPPPQPFITSSLPSSIDVK